MVRVDLFKNEPVKVGTAFNYSADVLPAYAEQVERFIRDAPDSLRADGKWLESVVTNLTKFEKGREGEIVQSSPLMTAFLSQRVLNSLF